MVIDPARRRLLRCAAAWTLTSPLRALARTAVLESALLGGWKQDGRDYVGIWQRTSGARGVEIPFRAHQVVVDPTDPHSVIAVARRPGEFLARIDLGSMQLSALQAIDADFAANGHAVFDAHARTLLVSENDVLTGEGAIGIYDADSLVCRARHPTFGIGPHALLREPGDTLLVANGGVLTLPQSGRTKLNAGSIDSSLVRLGPDGRRLGQWRFADRNLSIRHLAYTQQGTVGIALQGEHADVEERERAPVLAIFDGHSLRHAQMPAISLGGYGGDVASVDTSSGPLFAVGCTRASLVALWDGAGQYLGAYPLNSACALAAGTAALIAPSQSGEVGALAANDQNNWVVCKGAPAWDNHAVVWAR